MSYRLIWVGEMPLSDILLPNIKLSISRKRTINK
jgi:hypothetical protein